LRSSNASAGLLEPWDVLIMTDDSFLVVEL